MFAFQEALCGNVTQGRAGASIHAPLLDTQDMPGLFWALTTNWEQLDHSHPLPRSITDKGRRWGICLQT